MTHQESIPVRSVFQCRLCGSKCTTQRYSCTYRHYHNTQSPQGAWSGCINNQPSTINHQRSAISNRRRKCKYRNECNDCKLWLWGCCWEFGEQFICFETQDSLDRGRLMPEPWVITTGFLVSFPHSETPLRINFSCSVSARVSTNGQSEAGVAGWELRESWKREHGARRLTPQIGRAHV